MGSLGGRLKRDFLGVVNSIYQSDPAYIRPLDMELGDRLNPKKNPFFEHGEGAVFVAYKGGKPVGRATATIDREHLARYGDSTGFFGFLDTVDDEAVAAALLARAEAWLRERGMKAIRGPISLSINEEMGCLVEGFDTPPFIMMPHHRPYQAGLIEKAGFAKVKDVYAWSYRIGELNKRTARAQREMRELPEVQSRMVELKQLDRDVRLVVDIFNDAWNENWAFVPLTRNEVAKMAQDFKLLLVPELTRIVSIEGEPAAVALALPNLNEMIADLGGKILPFGIAKLLYRLKVKGPRSARMIILGIRKKFRMQRRYMPLSSFLYAEMNDSAAKLGIEFGECGWTLEDNHAVNAGIKMMGGTPYKKYRVFERLIA
jgi:hypothetical protein